MEPSDAELMDRIKATGDRAAFGCLVDRYKHPIVNYLTRLSGDRDRAEDLAQDTFLRLYQKRHLYRENGYLKPYIYRIATNLLRTQERTERRRRVLLLDFFHGAGEEHDGPSPQTAVLADERRQMLSRAVGELPLKFREPLVLYEVEGWTYGDIARHLGCREGTIKSRISRGKQRLRARLQPYRNGEAPWVTT